jgi:type IV pilus assembly protein PilX
MRSVISQSIRHRAGQRGAVLVTAMLLLLVLTIIGVTAMQMSRMQERMAGNTRDVNLAFQAAEGALRGSESFVRQWVARPVACSATPCNVWLEDSVAGTVANKNETWWTTNGQTFGQAAMSELRTPPVSVIEELGFVRTDGGVTMGQDPPDGRDFYQVTSRSTGGSGLAEIVLQTTYTRKF